MSQQTPQPRPNMPAASGRKTRCLASLGSPGILLLMLAGWALIAFLSELVMDSALFVEGKGDDLQLDGALAYSHSTGRRWRWPSCTSTTLRAIPCASWRCSGLP